MRSASFGTWSNRRESNPQPTDYKSVALPIELRQRIVGAPWGRFSLNRPQGGERERYLTHLSHTMPKEEICRCFAHNVKREPNFSDSLKYASANTYPNFILSRYQSLVSLFVPTAQGNKKFHRTHFAKLTA